MLQCSETIDFLVVAYFERVPSRIFLMPDVCHVGKKQSHSSTWLRAVPVGTAVIDSHSTPTAGLLGVEELQVQAHPHLPRGHLVEQQAPRGRAFVLQLLLDGRHGNLGAAQEVCGRGRSQGGRGGNGMEERRRGGR